MRERLKAFEEFVFARMTETALPGVSVAVVQGGEVTYARGFGFRDLEQGLPATPATLYGIGSVTKSFTCLAVMQLQERGLLSVEDPVDRYLDFPIRPFGEPVRLWHLMTHTSGIPALAYAEAVIREDLGARTPPLPIATAQDILTFMRGAEEWVETRPGERWFYLNEGYVLLGEVIAQVSGQEYERYVRENILEPLGMRRSFFDRRDVEADPDVATPYVIEAEKRRRPASYLYGKITSDGGLISNVEDMARYILMYLRSGQGEAGRIVAPESLAAMMEPRVPLPQEPYPAFEAVGAGSGRPGYYGYGLHVIPDFYGYRLIGHGGSVLVATAHMAFLPEKDLGIMLLANGSGYPLAQLAQYGLAVLMGEDPGRLPFLRAEEGLRALEGTYETFRGTMRAVVRRRGNLLTLTFEDRIQDETVTLVPEDLAPGQARFFALAGGRKLPVTFKRTEAGVDLLYERYKLRRVSAPRREETGR